MDRLLNHLPKIDFEDISVITDKDLGVGDEWNAKLQSYLDRTAVAVLLVSPAFLNSEYIRNQEMPVLLHRYNTQGLRIIPVILKPCRFNETRFKYPNPKDGPEEFSLATLLAAGSPTKTLSEMSDSEQERALLEVVGQIEILLRGATIIAALDDHSLSLDKQRYIPPLSQEPPDDSASERTAVIVSEPHAMTSEWSSLYERAYLLSERKYIPALYLEIFKPGNADRLAATHAMLGATIAPLCVEDLLKMCAALEADRSLCITGEPGTGVTMLMTTLFLEFRRRHIPSLYLDLSHHCVSKVDSIDEPLEIIGKLIALKREASDGIILTIFLDGVDERSILRTTHFEKFAELFETQSFRFVIGYRHTPGTSTLAELDPIFVTMKAVSRESPTFRHFSDCYCKAFAQKNSADFFAKLTAAGFPEADLFCLRLISRALSLPDNCKSLTEALEQFVRWRFRTLHTFMFGKKLPRFLRQAAHHAFLEFVRSEPEPDGDASIESERDGPEDSSKTRAAILELVRSHEFVRNFFVARHLLSQISKWGDEHSERRPQVIPYVFPQTVNTHCKEILSGTARLDELDLYDLHRAIARAAERILNMDVDNYMKANVCYLLGRFSLAQYQDKARSLLIAVLEQDNAKFINDKKRLMLSRSAYISLAVLNNKESTRRYVDKLIRDEASDAFNRGFHLEYYGDEKYIPSQPLQSADRLLGCNQTFSKLHDRIQSNAGSVMRWIDIQTYFSLGRHRYAERRLSDESKVKILDLARQLQNDGELPYSLRRFIDHVADELADQPGSFRCKRFWETYGIKWVKRAGWVDRGINFGESVADHTLGAIVIGLFFLPPTPHDHQCPYNKEDVLKLLFVHDLAEGKTGDYTPRQGNKDRKRLEEQQVFEVLGMIDNSGEGILGHCRDLWSRFDQKDYNGKVARDIDLIENLVQLKAYVREGVKVPDADIWERDIRRAVETDGTEEGRHALVGLDRAIEVLDDYLFHHLDRIQPLAQDWKKKQVAAIQCSAPIIDPV